jgi:hypothetical protein
MRRLAELLQLVRLALGGLGCRVFGHRYARAGVVQLKGWRPAVLVCCTRCGRAWRGVKP